MVFNFSVAEFTLADIFNLATQLLSHRLHAVANGQNGNASVKNSLADLVIGLFVGTHVRARENDAFRRKLANKVFGDVVGMHFAVHMCFTHAAGNQLRHLATEVQNKNTIVTHARWFR